MQTLYSQRQCMRDSIIFMSRIIDLLIFIMQAIGYSNPGEGVYGLYREVPPKRVTFFRLEVYKRVGISRIEV